MRLPKISNLEDHTGYWLRCLSNFVSFSFSEKLSGQGVTVPQWVLLRTLYNYESLALNQLAQLIGIDKGSASRTVERLVQRGLVERSEGSDRRSVQLRLTREAKKLLPKLAQLADENDRAFFHSLPEKQHREFLALIQQLLEVNGWKQSERGHYAMD